MADGEAEILTEQSENLDAFDMDMLSRIEGEQIAVGGHKPFMLDEEEEAAWLVLRGNVDVFAVEHLDGTVAGQRHHIAHIKRGEILMSVPSIPLEGRPGLKLGLLAVAAMGTQLFKGNRRKIVSSEFDLLTVNWVDTWIMHLSQAVARDQQVPRSSVMLEADPDQSFETDTVLSAQHLDVIWVELKEGAVRYMENEKSFTPESEMIALTEYNYATISEDAKLNGLYSPTALFREILWPNLDKFYNTILHMLAMQLSRARIQDNERIGKRLEAQDATYDRALLNLATLIEDIPERALPKIPKEKVLLAACTQVCSPLKIEVREPPRLQEGEVQLDAISRHSGFRYREVSLSRNWEKWDAGPLLGYLEKNESPVALMREKEGYFIYDPAEGTRTQVDDTTIGQLGPSAYMLYRPLPNRPLGLWDVMRFALIGMRKDYTIVIAMAMLGAGISLVMPIVTSELLAKAAPRGDFPAFYTLLLAMAMAMFGQLSFQMVSAFSLLRVESRMELHVQAAIWDRLMRIPVEFFRQYTAGDMADRANGFSVIRQTLTASALSAVLGVVTGIFNLGLMFYYSWRLALAGLLIIFIVCGVTLFFTRMQMPHQRALFNLQGRLDGLVFQLLSGVAKLRVSHNEAHAIGRWAEVFKEQKYHTYAARKWSAAQATFDSFFGMLSALFLYTMIYFLLLSKGYQSSFDLSTFLPFNAAFGQMMGAALALTGTISALIIIIPLFERAKPILQATEESSEFRLDPGELRGEIEFSKIEFRYIKDGANIIDGVSLHIAPGEYVAFAGASGSGKSTLYRLLLGFETPDAGAIYIDGQDLSNLDLSGVRRQLGVVLQNSSLIAGSILENIIGSNQLSLEDAWEAAHLAGLAKDIDDMPMKMHTVLPEGGAGLSGGQKQRLIIARALVRRPRVILFDEATSALDNKTQSIVQQSLEALNVTRVVIAHRLTTIRNADRIYMVENGSIVEYGKYDELMAKEGTFHRFAQRQIV